ncbi:hypothetical protein HYPP_03782 [Hyphomicrobium sp. ghe19]|nr:hypothetical protein HYPP_03782 [Hyphomicrobium sp. ghe19]
MLRTLMPRIRTMDTRTVRPPPKVAEDFYSSSEWRAFVADLIRERGRVCEDPQCDGRTHRPDMRVYADHIVEMRDGGAPLDRRNMMLRCAASHSRKTARERAKRMAKRDHPQGG